MSHATATKTAAKKPAKKKVSAFSTRKVDPAYYWMVVPAAIIFAFFLYLPFLDGVKYSFTNSQGYGDYKFIGLKNYIALFQDNRVGHAYLFTFLIAILITVLINVIALFLSVLLTALGLYHRLARYAGAGTLVPITGFANAVASPAIDFRAEGIVTGTAAQLAGETFDIEAEDADCHWSNRYDETAQRVDITINIDYHETGEHFHEAFSEYSYALDTVCALLEKYGFAVAKVADGESFGPVRGDSPRWIITAVKQYTQEEKANGTES